MTTLTNNQHENPGNGPQIIPELQRVRTIAVNRINQAMELDISKISTINDNLRFVKHLLTKYSDTNTRINEAQEHLEFTNTK